MQALGILVIIAVGIVVAGLTIAYVLVPLFKAIGWLLVNLFRAIGWLIAHVFEYIGGTIGDTLRLIGSVLTMIVLLPFAPLNVVLGRWSAAGHFASSIKRECKVAGGCVYRILLRRPLKLFWLHGILEGVEQRVPEAMAGAPTSDTPSKRTGQFDGYHIVGSLRGGGSGAKLYIAQPAPEKQSRLAGRPERVVIKSFALTEGSSLPQIVRESRALECAKQLGLVLEHGMDTRRFFYVMPYHPGDHLGVVTRQLHGESDGRGLDESSLRTVLSYVDDLLMTLAGYHQGGLWHKDVKPDNVIVHDGEAHLVDLGLVTPLRSAMTLTTHGTEYFRDPEMVRQALRGVKVHQVDGTKFDIYAAGAVLYFMIESTFPAHGGLSRFSKKSPETVRWIIRRAMAEYNQRYESADAMLADLRAVLAAGAVGSLRPVDLPSMRGETPPPIDVPGPDMAAAPQPAPTPPPIPVPTPTPAAGPAEPASSRPRIRVTNWWTGEYTVDDAPVAVAAAGTPVPPVPVAPSREQARAFRHHSQALRPQAPALRHRVKTGAISARRAAREQIKSARSRARDLQKRAHARRHTTRKAIAERQPSVFLGLLVLVFISIVVLGAIGVSRVARSGGPRVAISMPSPPAPPSAPMAADTDLGMPLLLVVEGLNPEKPRVKRQVKKIVESRTKQGYHVVRSDSDEFNSHMVALLNEWNIDRDGPADLEIEALLEAHNLYGLLWTDASGGGVSDTVIYSEKPEARERRRPDARFLAADNFQVPAYDPRPLLLVNDHPTKAEPAVQIQVQQILDDYRWNVIVDDESEAAVRQVLPSGQLAADTVVSSRFNNVLDELGLKGVVYVSAAAGNGPPEDRISVVRIDGQRAEDDASESAETADQEANRSMAINSGC